MQNVKWELDKWNYPSYMDESLVKELTLLTRDINHLTKCSSETICDCFNKALISTGGFFWGSYRIGVSPDNITDEVRKLIEKKREQLSILLFKNLNGDL
jgi:hypothetical protein